MYAKLVRAIHYIQEATVRAVLDAAFPAIWEGPEDPQLREEGIRCRHNGGAILCPRVALVH